MPKSKEQTPEALKAMIEGTQVKCVNEGLGLCAYFLELAALSLEENTTDLDPMLHTKMAHVPPEERQVTSS